MLSAFFSVSWPSGQANLVVTELGCRALLQVIQAIEYSLSAYIAPAEFFSHRYHVC